MDIFNLVTHLWPLDGLATDNYAQYPYVFIYNNNNNNINILRENKISLSPYITIILLRNALFDFFKQSVPYARLVSCFIYIILKLYNIENLIKRKWPVIWKWRNYKYNNINYNRLDHFRLNLILPRCTKKKFSRHNFNLSCATIRYLLYTYVYMTY